MLRIDGFRRKLQAKKMALLNLAQATIYCVKPEVAIETVNRRRNNHRWHKLLAWALSSLLHAGFSYCRS